MVQSPTEVSIGTPPGMVVATTQPVTFGRRPETTSGAASGPSVFEAFLNEQLPIGGYWKAILFATAAAVVLAVVGSAAHTYNLLNRAARKLGVSRRSGDEDAWDFFHNSDQVEWVAVRDYEHNRVYLGAVASFSDSEKNRELVLSGVNVFTEDTDVLLYRANVVYLSRDAGGWTIDVVSSPAADPVPTGDANVQKGPEGDQRGEHQEGRDEASSVDAATAGDPARPPA